MSLHKHFEKLQECFKVLLKSLESSWQLSHIEYIRDIVSHNEFEDAFANIWVIQGLNRVEFTLEQLGLLKDIAPFVGYYFMNNIIQSK